MESQFVLKGGTGEISEKKSKFIGSIWPVDCEETALRVIEQTKKEHYSANHNCYAYVIGNKDEIVRCSDDGEPTGTAGKPILDMIQKEGIQNALIIVTRYFGGTLLGTGGLVRAYQNAAKEGIKNSQIITKRSGVKLRLKTDYNFLGKLQYLTCQNKITITQSEYGQLVQLELLIPTESMEKFEKEILELTAGNLELTHLGKCNYGYYLDILHILES
ncbi:MAG: YigZ family protein [Anaerocolumna sp.]